MNNAATADRRRIFRAGLASVLGFAFDLYDLFIILFVASTIGPLLFPSEVPTLELAAVYASFAVSLLMRPLGGMIFGPYADRNGRKKAMVVTVSGVGIATALMGAVPTYATVGIVAPIVFVTLRLVQGVFVGGIVASTHTLGTESAGPRWRGLMSGLVPGGGAGIGALVASLVLLLVSALFPGEAFNQWGWRVMFFTGLAGAVMSFFIFRKVEESPVWAMQQAGAMRSTPIRTLFSQRYRSIVLLNLLLVAGSGTLFYLVSGFLPTFLGENVGLDRSEASILLIIANVVVILSAILGGQVSEWIGGRRRAFWLFGVLGLVFLPILYLLGPALPPDAMGVTTLFVIGAVFLANATYGPLLIFLNERFPTDIRATGTAFCWNTGFALGGITPTFVTAFSPTVDDIPMAIAIVLAIASTIYLIGTYLAPETRGRLESESKPL